MSELKFVLGAYRFAVDEVYVTYKSVYGARFRVPKKNIEAVTIEGGVGKSVVKLTGAGNTLAEVELPTAWAEKVQTCLMKELGL